MQNWSLPGLRWYSCGRFALALVLVLLASTMQAQTPIPTLEQPVTDQAGVLSDSVKRFLNQNLTRLHRQGGSQVAVLTVSRLFGEPIEQYSIRVAEAWQLGSRERDNGVILILSVDDRQVRIEVGQGLEGDLTDAYSSRIIRNQMIPLFKESDYDAGVVAGVSAIVSHTDPGFSWEGEQGVQPRRSKSKPVALEFFLVLFAALFIVIFGGRRGRFLRGHHHRGRWDHFGGGGFGGGGFGGGGGGGFSGGGGGFSGGGASGGW